MSESTPHSTPVLACPQAAHIARAIGPLAAFVLGRELQRAAAPFLSERDWWFLGWASSGVLTVDLGLLSGWTGGSTTLPTGTPGSGSGDSGCR